MSSNPKKRQPAARISDHSSDESDESCSENGYSGDEEQSSAEDEIQVDIEGQAITESETANIQWFLKELLPEGGIDVALAAKEITAQKGIGSVVKSDSIEGMEDDSKEPGLDKGGGEEGEEASDTLDTLGVTTVLGLRDNDLSKQIVSFLHDQASNSGKGQELGEILGSKKTQLGWLVHERFPSIPAGIAPYLLRTVLAELKGSSVKSQHDLTHFVVITKAYDTASPTKQSSSSKGAAKKPHLDLSAHELVYEYPEMELFAKEATICFTWELKGAESGVSGVGDERGVMKPMRVALLLPAKTFELLVSTLEEALQRL